MAEFNSYLLGKARKSVGNITLCYTRGKNIAKAKVFARKDNPTPEILAQRARMKALVQLSRQLLPVIRKGFAGIGRGSAANALDQSATELVTFTPPTGLNVKTGMTLQILLISAIALGVVAVGIVSNLYNASRFKQL